MVIAHLLAWLDPVLVLGLLCIIAAATGIAVLTGREGWALTRMAVGLSLAFTFLGIFLATCAGIG